MANKWNISGWGAAQGEITHAMLFLCDGKSAAEREAIAEEVARLVRALARGDKPSIQANQFTQHDQYELEVWAKNAADRLISSAMLITECSTTNHRENQNALLREIAKIALWHMPNASTEARQLAKLMDIEALKNPHPRDDPAPEA
jgi:hypothetical protein